MTYTQAQIDKANAVDLEKFLRAQGETLVRSGKECRWKAHDSLTVCGNKWFRHSQSKGGFPVDFVMEFYGKSFPEAVQMLTGEPGEAQPEADPAPSPAFRLPLRNVTNAFIVATHTDREHIHNHIIYNSTALDSTRKFRDFLLSGLAVQRLSDLICLEHQLSVIEIKPYRERQKRTLYLPKENNRDRLCGVIDTILAEKPKDYEDMRVTAHSGSPPI